MKCEKKIEFKTQEGRLIRTEPAAEVIWNYMSDSNASQGTSHQLCRKSQIGKENGSPVCPVHHCSVEDNESRME